MKTKLLSALAVMVFLLQWQICGRAGSGEKTAPGTAAVKAYYDRQTDALLQGLSLLDSAAAGGRPLPALQRQFTACRFNYKKIEAITEYYFQGLTRRINGPALPDVRTEDGTVWPPHGFQVIEQLLYGGYSDSLQGKLSGEIKLLQTDLRFMRSSLAYNAVSSNHVSELIQHGLIRIAALGITGFDAPLSRLSLPEASYSLYGIQEIAALYTGTMDDAQQKLLAAAIHYLDSHMDFDTFNRLEFLRNYLMPLSDAYSHIPGFNAHSDSLLAKPFRGTLSQLMKGKGFNADYYSSYAAARSSEEKIELGKKLFFDTRLSESGKISCAGCHQPALYFTDGREKAGDFIHGGSLPRNTPTLFYAALQSHQFFDLRSVTLEDQADAVMQSSREFNFTAARIAGKLWADTAYVSLFRRAFGIKDDTISGFEVRNALAAFVRSLSPFSSPFDAYMNGRQRALTEEQVAGFNLFAGKAKCATCHFIPLFNGNIPPWFTGSESEIIGVPAKAVWQHAVIDPDSGRYKVNRLPELLFAFKTPTVRNVAKTAPYMHNGVYKTLDEVVAFYHKGGGAGLGIKLPFQTLPFDSLSLNQREQKAIVRFLESLTDKAIIQK